ncbi:MAG: hypothetical protein GEV06_01305 [Luteitalea sp.]|nr:hypothetical protein [Luteitalea sp.]
MPTDDASTFTNTGGAGINRLVALDDLLLIDNIGRNFEIRRLTGEGHEPAFTQIARYDVTIFPGEDIPSILDLDVHGASLSADGSLLLVCNHYGHVRCFEWPVPRTPTGGRLTSSVEVQLLGDTERVLFCDDCLIVSSPRGSYTLDPPTPGIVVSERVTSSRASARAVPPRRLTYVPALQDWGTVIGLAIDTRLQLLAVASGDRVGVFGLESTKDGLRVGRCLWKKTVAHSTQWLVIDSLRERLLSAGHDGTDSDPDGDDWNACRGGVLNMFSLRGEVLSVTALPDTTAWGYGSDPLVLSSDGTVVYAVDRTAGLHALDVATGRIEEVCGGLRMPDGQLMPSLGIGHCALVDRRLYAGFSRGGYRLFHYDTSAAAPVRKRSRG